MMEVTERVVKLANEPFWEIKAQCMEFAITMLDQFKSLSHLLAQKDEVKGGGKTSAGAERNGKPGSGINNPNQDRNAVKVALTHSVDIIKRCFNSEAPKSVQKLGLFKLQPLVNDYPLLYFSYVDALVKIDDEIK